MSLFFDWEEEYAMATKTHISWEKELPLNNPKAIRYIINYKPELGPRNLEGTSKTFKEFLQNSKLRKDIGITSYSTSIGWVDRYNEFVVRAIKAMRDLKPSRPKWIDQEKLLLTSELKPVSLGYDIEREHDFHHENYPDTLVFYNDILTAQIYLTRYNPSLEGPADVDSIIEYVNGQKQKEHHYDLHYLEEQIRKTLGENTNSFELHGGKIFNLV